MTAAATAALAVAAVAAVANWFAVAGGDKRVECIAKPCTMAALVMVAVLLDPASDARRWWFVAAGVFSLAGDVFLMLPRDRFLHGLAAFLAAHVCYIGGLLQLPVATRPALVGAALVAVGVTTQGRRVLRALQEGGRGRLVVPVVAYMTVISAMVVAAFATGPALAVAGALTFYLSDSILAERRFVRPHPWAAVGVMVTYHVGQAALVLSLPLG